MRFPIRFSRRTNIQSDHFKQTMVTRIQTLQLKLENFVLDGATLKEQYSYAFEQHICKILLETLQNSNYQISLKDVIAKAWNRIRGTFLAYTARPDAEITQIMCTLCEHIKTPNAPAITLLMPDILIEDMRNDQPPLTNMPLQEILNTHILSDSGRYLIPIATLNGISLPLPPQLKLPNYYYDVDITPGESGYISDNELKRLFAHSEHTKALQLTISEYELNLDPKSLLFHLYHLIHHLHSSSVLKAGEEEDAEASVYDTIKCFFEYFDALGDKRAGIPQVIANEIDFLRSLSSNHNLRQHNMLDTCLNTRRDTLQTAVRQFEDDLAKISLAAQIHQTQAEQAKLDFNYNQQQLGQLLLSHNYAGKDTLSNKAPFLGHIIHGLKITTIEDVKTIFSLPADDTKKLLYTYNLVEQCTEHFLSGADFLAFALEYDDNHLKIATSTILRYLYSENPDEQMMSSFRPVELLRIVKAVLAFEDSDLFLNGFLDMIFKELSLDKQDFFHQTVIPLVISHTKEAKQFCSIFRHLNTKQQRDFIKALAEAPNGIQSWITDANDFNELLEHLDNDLREQIINTLGNVTGLLQYVTTLSEGILVFQRLTTQQRLNVMQSLKCELPNLIKNCDDTSDILNFLKFLDQEERSKIFSDVFGDPKIVRDFINNAVDFYNLLRSFLPSERTILYSAYEQNGEFIGNLITSAEDFLLIFTVLSHSEQQTLLPKILSRLPTHINDPYDYINIVSSLSPSLRHQVFSATKHILGNVIDNARGFYDLLVFLQTQEQRSFVFNQIESIEKLIDGVLDFKWVLKHLAPSARTQVFNKMLDIKPMFFDRVCQEDFDAICKYLKPEECEKVAKIVKDLNINFTPMFNLTQQQQSANNDSTAQTIQSISKP